MKNMNRKWMTLLAVVAPLAAAACDVTAPSRTVDIYVSADKPLTSVVSASQQLEVTSLQLVVGAASLGSGQEFGCVDCQGNYDDAPSLGPRVVDVPVDGGAVQVAAEGVGPARRHITEAEISLEAPTGASPDWPGDATIRIAGSFAGTPFTLALNVTGDFRASVDPPLDISDSDGLTELAVTIALPVASWFTSNGVALDPTNADQRASIEANIRQSFTTSEPETAAEPDS